MLQSIQTGTTVRLLPPEAITGTLKGLTSTSDFKGYVRRAQVKGHKVIDRVIDGLTQFNLTIKGTQIAINNQRVGSNLSVAADHEYAHFLAYENGSTGQFGTLDNEIAADFWQVGFGRHSSIISIAENRVKPIKSVSKTVSSNAIDSAFLIFNKSSGALAQLRDQKIEDSKRPFEIALILQRGSKYIKDENSLPSGQYLKIPKRAEITQKAAPIYSTIETTIRSMRSSEKVNLLLGNGYIGRSGLISILYRELEQFCKTGFITPKMKTLQIFFKESGIKFEYESLLIASQHVQSRFWDLVNSTARETSVYESLGDIYISTNGNKLTYLENMFREFESTKKAFSPDFLDRSYRIKHRSAISEFRKKEIYGQLETARKKILKLNEIEEILFKDSLQNPELHQGISLYTKNSLAVQARALKQQITSTLEQYYDLLEFEHGFCKI